MARDIIINGEAMVRVRFGGHITSGHITVSGVIPAGGITSNPDSPLYELGLASEDIRVIPRLVGRDVRVDDWGPEVPADVIRHLAEAWIRMTLVHYDKSVLEACYGESMGGTTFSNVTNGKMQIPAAGRMMGGGIELTGSGNHFIDLSISSPVLNYPWHFRAAYLFEQPLEIPLGTSRSMTMLNWRAIPYGAAPRYSQLQSGGTVPEMTSIGNYIWDHAKVDF